MPVSENICWQIYPNSTLLDQILDFSEMKLMDLSSKIEKFENFLYLILLSIFTHESNLVVHVCSNDFELKRILLIIQHTTFDGL